MHHPYDLPLYRRERTYHQLLWYYYYQTKLFLVDYRFNNNAYN